MEQQANTSLSPRLRKTLLITLSIASVCYLLGICLPMMKLTKLVFFENYFSIVSGLWQLLSEGKVLLFLLIGAFSIVMPALKISLLFTALWYKDIAPAGKIKHYLHLMHEYGRWAMLDVLIVAVLVVAVKLGVLATVDVKAGLYFFAASVLLISMITHWVVNKMDA